MDELGELRELERRDAQLSRDAGGLRALDAEVADVRARAEEIEAFLATYPAADDRLRASAAQAEDEIAQRGVEVVAARSELGRARDAEARTAAERVLARAEDHLSVAESRLARVASERAELEREAGRLPADLPALAERAAAVGRGAPDPAPQALLDWARRTHAALFAEAAQLDLQRDRVIREANELATMLLGEPTFGSTPAQARARVEAALR